MNQRFRELRKALGLTQAEYGEILGIKTSGVSDIESGRNSVTERHIASLEAYDPPGMDAMINGNWIRTGEGQMFLEKGKRDRLISLTAKLLKDKPDSFKARFVAAMDTLSESDWAVLEKLWREISGK